MIPAILTVLGLGFVYFISAIPAGVALKLHPGLAALVAWLGYSLGSWVILLVGAPLRNWVAKRVKLLNEPRDDSKLFWRIWRRFGLPGLGLIAPVTCGPQGGSVIALALGEKPARIGFWFSVGGIPYAIGFALAAAFGKHLASG
ncbi:MAG TPA: hypothetical protein VIS74_00520 [Chthoniobacterales bacterium]